MKRAARTAAIAFLAVLAVAFAAGTLDSAATTTPEGTGGIGPDGEGGGLLPPPRPPQPLETVVEIPYLSELVSILVAVAVLLAVVYAIRHPKSTVRAILLLAVVLATIPILARLFGRQSGGNGSAPVYGNGSLPGAAGGSGSDALAPIAPPSTLLLIVGLVVGAAILAAVVRSREAGDDEPGGESVDDAAAVGRAAGRAADRIERDADADNEVYRAWREMTDLLDVPDPDTSTPGEFADAAVEAGLGRDDVDALTRLFEDVRYGGREASPARERSAVSVFRRIERRYAGEEA